MDDIKASNNDIITVPIKVKDFNSITGYQFTLNWDASALEFQSVNNVALISYFGTTEIANGKLAVQWNDNSANAISLNDNTVLFELKFKVSSSNITTSAIEINSDITKSEAYNNNLDLVTIQSIPANIKLNLLNDIAVPESDLYSLTAYPNPFTESSTISFTIQVDEYVQIAIYNSIGQIIADFSDFYKKGNNNITWLVNNKNCNQEYLILQFYTSSFQQSIPLLFLK